MSWIFFLLIQASASNPQCENLFGRNLPRYIEDFYQAKHAEALADVLGSFGIFHRRADPNAGQGFSEILKLLREKVWVGMRDEIGVLPRTRLLQWVQDEKVLAVAKLSLFWEDYPTKDKLSEMEFVETARSILEEGRTDRVKAFLPKPKMEELIRILETHMRKKFELSYWEARLSLLEDIN